MQERYIKEGSPCHELSLADFPVRLREISDPPKRLWLRGALAPAEHKLLAVVGSRALTRYGREACQYLISGLAGWPVSIISGLALGADACAHEAALDAGLHTVALPGSGIADEALYPRRNAELATRILSSGGALLSEFEPLHKPHAYDFPARNRLMVGMAHAVLVIEAGPKSGTLITARLAADYNRDLLCVPHRIGDAHAEASHTFLRLGATLIAEPAHILEALGFERELGTESSGNFALPNLSPDERALFDLLAEPRARDDIMRAFGHPAHVTLSLLGTLELKGVLVESFGLWRRR